MENSNLLILGGSGAIGSLVIEYAIERGHQVTVIVRNKTSVEHHKSIKIIEGNVLDDALLAKAIEGQDAVISCLGIKRKNGKNPWSSLISPANFAEQVTTKVLHQMEQQQVPRFIAVSSAGVGNSKKSTSLAMNSFIRISNVKLSIADLGNMEQAMQLSPLDTLAIRPVGLTDSQQMESMGLVDKFNMSSTISRTSVALWLIDAVTRPGRFNQPAEMIGNL